VPTGHFSQRGTYKGEPFEISSRQTEAYMKRSESWRAFSAHATKMPR